MLHSNRVHHKFLKLSAKFSYTKCTCLGLGCNLSLIPSPLLVSSQICPVWGEKFSKLSCSITSSAFLSFCGWLLSNMTWQKFGAIPQDKLQILQLPDQGGGPCHIRDFKDHWLDQPTEKRIFQLNRKQKCTNALFS